MRTLSHEFFIWLTASFFETNDLSPRITVHQTNDLLQVCAAPVGCRPLSVELQLLHSIVLTSYNTVGTFSSQQGLSIVAAISKLFDILLLLAMV